MRRGAIFLLMLMCLPSISAPWEIKFSQPRTLGRGFLRRISCSKDGKLLAALTTAGTWLYRVEDLSEPAYIPSDPFSAAFSPDGEIIAIGEKDGSISLWRIKGMERISTLKGHADEVTALCFSPDGELLASGGWRNDGAVIIWDARGGRRTAVLKGHPGGVTDLRFSPDGKLLASVSFSEGLIRIWRADGWKRIDVKRGISAAFSPDGSILASGGGRSGKIWDGTVRIWDLKGMGEERTLKSGGYIRSLYLTPGGRLICHAMERWEGDLIDVICVWDLRTGKLIGAIRGFTDEISSLAFSPDGRVLAGGSGSEIFLWNPLSGEEIGRLRVLGRANDIAFGPGGEILAVGTASTSAPLQIWDARGGKLRAVPRGHIRPVYSWLSALTVSFWHRAAQTGRSTSGRRPGGGGSAR